MLGYAEYGFNYNLTNINFSDLLQGGSQQAIDQWKTLPLATPGLFNTPVYEIFDMVFLPNALQVQKDVSFFFPSILVPPFPFPLPFQSTCHPHPPPRNHTPHPHPLTNSMPLITDGHLQTRHQLRGPMLLQILQHHRRRHNSHVCR